ncbi:alanine--tRNA ligase, mitochondrial [Culicoides brevitarsis]|uniref:alanine--tRNA ligase, mitochondrial n=1 Tax=Culicoides brevitarsis TaxID=469753 RepID=UPI00307C2B1A
MQINAARCSSKHILPARLIREQFLNFFVKEKNHSFVRSSPVVPFCDKSLAFVNAGMNQFKNVFLDRQQPPYPRVANTQKCVRVGGKHNDLEIIGSDGYHHTFFEMLGNWSFNDYFKKEACTMALELLTGPYKINPNRLYVTYFKGDAELGLEPDLETFEIWRSLGFAKERILPFDKKDNFWEMGDVGPCGPCTEIHFDHLGTSLRADFVNSGLADLTELWNLVFIQYNRNSDGSISSLPHKNIDTGMGFERLVAVLQEKSSNYDTDLFLPLFDGIQKACPRASPYAGTFTNDLDKDYRILADHGRMVTACIADGMFPDNNYKLRRVLRKMILVGEKSFGNDRLVFEIIPRVVESLGETFPEMQNFNQILKVVDHEFEIYKNLRKDVSKGIKTVPLKMVDLIENDLLDYPGIIFAYKNLMLEREKWKRDEKSQKLIVPNEYAFKLCDTYGLDVDAIGRLCEMEQLLWNRAEFRSTSKRLNAKLKKFGGNVEQKILEKEKIEEISSKFNIRRTNDIYKYNSQWDEAKKKYVTQRITAKIIAAVTKDNKIWQLVTDKSNFYHESGGQVSDKGLFLQENVKFSVKNVFFENGFVIHEGSFDTEGSFSVGSDVEMIVNDDFRTGTTSHHTATHLLNGIARAEFALPCCQKSSLVLSDQLKLELSIYGPRLTREQYQRLENGVRDAIKSGFAVRIDVIDEQKLLSMSDVVTVPGEIYPDTGLRLVQVGNSVSKELCCGTHAQNTAHLGDFCLTNVKLTGRASYIFTAVVGDAAKEAHRLGEELLAQAKDIQRTMNKDNVSMIERDIMDLQETLRASEEAKQFVPYCVKNEILSILGEVEAKCRAVSKEQLREFVEIEMKSLLEAKPKEEHPFLVHYLASALLMESVPLHRVTKYVTDRPIIVISYTGTTVKARCCVPEEFQSTDFNAEKWLLQVAHVFESQIETTKGSKIVCNMKDKRINVNLFAYKLEKALGNANAFAEFYFLKKS